MLNTNTQHAAAAPRRHLSASVRRLAEMRLSASQDGQDSPAVLIDADAELSETGVEQAVVSPAAISITVGRAGCSYRDRTDHTG